MKNFSLRNGFWAKIIIIAAAIFVMIFIIFGLLEVGVSRVIYDQYQDLNYFIYDNRHRTFVWIAIVFIIVLYNFLMKLKLKNQYIKEIVDSIETVSKNNEGKPFVSLSSELVSIETIINEELNKAEKLDLKERRLQSLSYSRRRGFTHQCKQPITSVIGHLEFINEVKEVSPEIRMKHLDEVSVSLFKIKHELEGFIQKELESQKGKQYEK